MLSRRDDPFPFDATRDLIGLVRAMYRAEVRAKAPPVRLAKIAAIGLALQEAYDLAAMSGPKTTGTYAAWTKAEQAATALGDVIEPWTMMQPILWAAVGAVRSRRSK